MNGLKDFPTASDSSITSAINELPGMRRVLNGVRPETVNLTLTDDLSGSGAYWARQIEVITRHLVDELTPKFAAVKWDYVGMRDMDIGEEDEYRIKAGSGEELLREQKLVKREGGGDPAETFAQTVENLLSAPDWMPDTGPLEARALVMTSTSDTKPAKHNSMDELGKELKRRRIKLFVIGTPGTNLVELTTAAEGFFFELSANPTAAEAQKIATILAATVSSTVGRGGTTPGTARGTTEGGLAASSGPPRTPAGAVGRIGDTVAVP